MRQQCENLSFFRSKLYYCIDKCIIIIVEVKICIRCEKLVLFVASSIVLCMTMVH